MKRFRFSLTPVAVVRAHRELRAKEAFASAVHAYGKTQEELAQVRAALDRLEAAMAAGRKESFSPADEAHALLAHRQQAVAEAEAERVSATARATMEQRRGEYIAAHRQLEVVRRLEDKARATHRGAAFREEQAEFDDYASRRALRTFALKR